MSDFALPVARPTKKLVKNAEDESTKEILEETPQNKGENSNNNNNSNQALASLKYNVPEWGGWSANCHNYQLDILKSGVIVETKDLFGKSFYVVGRLPMCDVIMDHPSISRQHAVFQHRHSDGSLFVYDLGSTHGTRVNKKAISANQYVQVCSGDVIRFGESTRLLLLKGGPIREEDDEEEESHQQQQQSKKESPVVATSRSQSVTSKPVATTKPKKVKQDVIPPAKKTTKEEEQEGEDANEEEEENLDWTDTSRVHQLQEGDAADQFSDDDEFYDRTESKRKKQKHNNQEAYTYEGLLQEKESLMKEQSTLEMQLSKIIQKSTVASSEDTDSLDSFMSSVSASITSDEQTKLQAQLESNKKELQKIEKLIQLSAPALPALQKVQKPSVSHNNQPTTTTTTETTQTMTAKTQIPEEQNKITSSTQTTASPSTIHSIPTSQSPAKNTTSEKKKKVIKPPPPPPDSPKNGVYDDDLDYSEVPLSFYSKSNK